MKREAYLARLARKREAIVSYFETHKNMAATGRRFRITRQRVAQIVKRNGK